VHVLVKLVPKKKHNWGLAQRKKRQTIFNIFAEAMAKTISPIFASSRMIQVPIFLDG